MQRSKLWVLRIGIRRQERGRITAFRVPYIRVLVAEVVEAVDGGKGTFVGEDEVVVQTKILLTSVQRPHHCEKDGGEALSL
jgi:hypothetical protein